ncbi:hypothetical protein J3Q64DRAFT_1743786 [Phycomyces blakesleeanus]|uniref:Uncharacterized protein n=1 Tax=Phycomyces blakesleeanus TaxID=4837 RepID=A0ABR3AZA0_PHYBL
MNSGQKLAMISLFQSNPNAFRHLETFNFTIDEYFVFGDFVLWELFYALKVPLKHLELDGTHCDEVDRSYPIDIDRILRSFSETLESLSLTGFIYSDNDENSILELSSYYPVLTNICINSDGSSLNLGNLLDRCVALKQLKFGAGYLSIDPETTTEESAQQKQEQHYQHGLQILILHECAVTTELLNYFSFRCRSLEYMTLDNVFIEGSICEKTGCMLLDMTHTSLKTLNIGLLQYGTSDEVTGPNHTIDLTLVSQLSDEKNETEKKEMDSKWPIIGINHIGWFHTYSIWNYCGRAYIYTMKLTEKGSNTPLEYYQNLRSNRISQTVKDASLCNENISKMERYCRLDYGYAELRFKKIKTALVKYEKEYFDW